jgi:hypothetical protein
MHSTCLVLLSPLSISAKVISKCLLKHLRSLSYDVFLESFHFSAALGHWLSYLFLYHSLFNNWARLLLSCCHICFLESASQDLTSYWCCLRTLLSSLLHTQVHNLNNKMYLRACTSLPVLYRLWQQLAQVAFWLRLISSRHFILQ